VADCNRHRTALKNPPVQAIHIGSEHTPEGRKSVCGIPFAADLCRITENGPYHVNIWTIWKHGFYELPENDAVHNSALRLTASFNGGEILKMRGSLAKR
jgi:hypothetical protein